MVIRPLPECQNRVDDDGDGLVDYPFDTDCEDENDALEWVGDQNPVTGSAGWSTVELWPDVTIPEDKAPDEIPEKITEPSYTNPIVQLSEGGCEDGLPGPCIITNPEVVDREEDKPTSGENINASEDQESDALQTDTSDSVLPPEKTQPRFIDIKKTPSRDPEDISLSSAPEKERDASLSEVKNSTCQKFSCRAERWVYQIIHFVQEFIGDILKKLQIFFRFFQH
jgi:hypothetical protein